MNIIPYCFWVSELHLLGLRKEWSDDAQGGWKEEGIRMGRIGGADRIGRE